MGEAVKLVYASTFFAGARDYRRAVGFGCRDEKMAVIVQEVLGRRHDQRFYPTLSGVARSFNYYPFGHGQPEDGVVTLALGLGKTVVDGDPTWSYCPKYPRSLPPAGGTADLLRVTQSRFWAVNMGPQTGYHPARETEYLVQASLAEADYDGQLPLVASTWDPESDRLTPGAGRGPKLLSFAPLLDLELLPLNRVVSELLATCEETLGAAVEMEFAMVAPEGDTPARLGFLQVRPMVVQDEAVEVSEADLDGPDLLLASRRAVGNGERSDIRHVLYVRPDGFESRHTRAIAAEIGPLNRRLEEAGLPYLLIGFGRWGSSDPWLGIPVEWGSISGAKAVVEAMVGGMNVEMSQGSHFFHNLSSFEVPYLGVPDRPGAVDWSWLAESPTWAEGEFVRCVELARPLRLRVDGRSGRATVAR